MQDGDVAFANLHALGLLRRLNLLCGDDLALEKLLLAFVLGHVEQDAARYDRRDFVDAHLLDAGHLDEVLGGALVVERAVNAEVSQAVKLSADAQPPVEHVVKVTHLVRAECFALLLARHEHGDRQVPRRKGWRTPVDGDAEAISLARGDEFGRLEHLLRAQTIERADFVIWTHFDVGTPAS